LATIPGVGVINATALVAAIGDGSAFAKGRDLSAWLGLVPRQHSTGGKTKLLGISKRGNQYLRRQLIHGARSVLLRLKETQTPMGNWLSTLLGRPRVSLWSPWPATAPIAWALLRHRTIFRSARLRRRLIFIDTRSAAAGRLKCRRCRTDGLKVYPAVRSLEKNGPSSCL
jgi:hypothetical protein